GRRQHDVQPRRHRSEVGIGEMNAPREPEQGVTWLTPVQVQELLERPDCIPIASMAWSPLQHYRVGKVQLVVWPHCNGRGALIAEGAAVGLPLHLSEEEESAIPPEKRGE